METDDLANSSQSEERRADRHRYQLGTQTLFVLLGIAAVFFCVTFILNYVEATIILLALTFLFRALRRPQRVHLITAILLTLVAAILLWANLKPSRFEVLVNGQTPTDLDPITKKMFWRGWPLSPFMLCHMHHMVLEPDGCLVQGTLIIDIAFFVVAICAAKAVSERFLRWLTPKKGKKVNPG